MSKDRLGRGLGALLGDYTESGGGEGPPAPATTIPVRAIVPNPYQPRIEFEAEELNELAASIDANGLLQPILVRPGSAEGTYELVAGERRFRATKQLGWADIPAQVRTVDDRTLLVLALVENIQREALGPIEEAKGYGVLRDEFGFTQSEIADSVGKSRSAVANMLRLLLLPPSVRKMVEAGELTMGHARALLSLGDGVRAGDMAQRAVADEWSVRETEEQVRRAVGTAPKGKARQDPPPRDPAVAALEEALQAHLGTRAAIQWRGKGVGKITISFQDVRDLERVYEAITGQDPNEVVG